MPTAYVLIRQLPHYRHDSFVSGLKAVGFRIQTSYDGQGVAPGDVLVIWNRYAHFDDTARRFEAARARVIVAENGYIGADEDGRQLYALALSRHNGFGSWRVGDEDRWSKLGIELAPWRKEGRHILVCLQRGIGTAPVASPPDLQQRAADALRGRTGGRLVVFRFHPESPYARDQAPLEEHLREAHACVIWTSSAGVKALVAGVPVFHMAERWICEDAASRNLADVTNPPRPDRLPALQRMSWAQWRLKEIESGEAFRSLLA